MVGRLGAGCCFQKLREQRGVVGVLTVRSVVDWPHSFMHVHLRHFTRFRHAAQHLRAYLRDPRLHAHTLLAIEWTVRDVFWTTDRTDVP